MLAIQVRSNTVYASVAKNQQQWVHQDSKKINELFHAHKETPFPDKQLAKTFNERYFYSEEGFSVCKVKYYQKTLTDYWRVAQIMQRKGLIPLVHGQSAMWSIPQRILKSLEFNQLELIRLTNPGSLKKASEIRAMIDAHIYAENGAKGLTRFLPFYAKKNTVMDHVPEIRDSLLSVSIGLFHLDRCESPFSLVFGGIYRGSFMMIKGVANRSMLPLEMSTKIADSMIIQALQIRGYNEGISADLIKSVQNIYKEADKLPIGQIIVCGVPMEDLSNVAYHSEPFGYPTGIPIQKIVEDVSQKRMPQECTQARLLLCEETIQSKSIEVINVMDRKAVQSYCEGTDFLPPEKEEGLKDLLEINSLFDASLEDNTRTQICNLYERIDGVIQNFQLDKKE